MGKPITEQYHAVEEEIKLDRMIEFEIAQTESNVICYKSHLKKCLSLGGLFNNLQQARRKV